MSAGSAIADRYRIGAGGDGPLNGDDTYWMTVADAVAVVLTDRDGRVGQSPWDGGARGPIYSGRTMSDVLTPQSDDFPRWIRR